jgi:hypothetical protein
MRALLKLFIFLVLPLCLAYVAWPIHAALQIREAMIAGDVATLYRKIDWDDLREHLKNTLKPETIQRLALNPDGPPPTLWQRIKAAIAPSIADSVIDRYVTPEHLPVMLGYHRSVRGKLVPIAPVPQPEPPTVLADTYFGGTPIDEFASFWKRVRRAVFLSPGRFEMEVEDKYKPNRRYVGTFELRGFEWKLVALSITGDGF